MAAAVAKAPEKSKVPGNPQVLCNSPFHSDTAENSPTEPSWRDRSQPFPPLGCATLVRLFLGKNKTVKTTTKETKPSTELFFNFLNLFKPTCWGGKHTRTHTIYTHMCTHHRAPTSDLEKWSKKSCCSRSPDGGVLRLGARGPHGPAWSSVSVICDSSPASIHWMFQSLNACFVSWKTIVLTYKRHKNQINTLLSNTIYNRGC